MVWAFVGGKMGGSCSRLFALFSGEVSRESNQGYDI